MRSVYPILSQVQALIESVLPRIVEMRYDVTWKPDGSPVTAADIYLENEIQSLIKQEIPDLVFIGEETWSSSASSAGSWIAVLDPIDGTENFCSGLKEWGVSLSFWHEGNHAGSMLMLPEMGEIATSGAIPKIPRSRITGFSSSYNETIGREIAANSESRIIGCAVYNLYNVIRGAFARFYNPKGAYSWDLIAGVALARESGCEIQIDGMNYDGQYLEPGRRYRVDIRHRYDFHPRQGAIPR